MLVTVAIFLGVLGHLSNGVPLEDETADFSQFFDQRIVGGSVAEDGHSEFMVALVVGRTWQSFVCGGSVLTPRHILTAAHCITSFILWEGGLVDTFHAIVGSNHWHQGSVVDVADYRLHPDYDSWSIKSDAGVLLAKTKIKFDERVGPIGLHFDFVGGGHKCFVTGWGTEWLWGPTPSHLKILEVSTISPEACVQAVKEAAALLNMWAPHVDAFLEICTFHSPGHGVCHGDSGSALVSKKLRKQTGIVSWGFPCAIGAPDVYVRVSGVKEFILEALKYLK